MKPNEKAKNSSLAEKYNNFRNKSVVKLFREKLGLDFEYAVDVQSGEFEDVEENLKTIKTKNNVKRNKKNNHGGYR